MVYRWFTGSRLQPDYRAETSVFIQAESASGKSVESVRSQLVDELTRGWTVEGIPVEDVRNDIPEETVRPLVLTPLEE